jgi:hypothetical protein
MDATLILLKIKNKILNYYQLPHVHHLMDNPLIRILHLQASNVTCFSPLI